MIVAARTWTRFIALGDSVTEGWCDPVVGDGAPWFGWADRLALSLDADSRAAGGPRLEFANLAVRGRRVRHVVDEQAPAARAMGGDLVSIQVGGNDLMSFRIDPDELAASLEPCIAELRRGGATVLLATVFDPGRARMLRVLRQRTALFNAHLGSIAARHGCVLLDLWGLEALRERSAWSEDRIHPSTLGHLAIARTAATQLGVDAMPSHPDAGRTAGLPISTLDWVRRHGLPWLGRRLRRVSSGDGMGPKLPEPRPIDARP